MLMCSFFFCSAGCIQPSFKKHGYTKKTARFATLQLICTVFIFYQNSLNKGIFVVNLLLKTLDTIGNCQRPVFSLGVSQHMHKITTCENLSLIGRWSCEITTKEKTPLSHEDVCFQMLEF